MKIDLHCHTIKTKEGDGINRNIEKDNFKKIMVDANVGMVAITNHNIFDIKQFREFQSNEYILLPGIELDVKYKDSKKQLNVIWNPADVENFDSKIEFLFKSYEEIDFKTIIEIFDSENTIFYLDHKRHENGVWWKEPELKEFKEIAKLGVVIADSNNSRTQFILMANKFNCLIGTDIQDWSEYLKESEKLLSTNVKVENYDKFISILRYDEEALNQLLSSNTPNIFENFIIKIPGDSKKSVNGIKEENIGRICIYKGVNVIFGPKSTGKSKILEGIKDTHNESVLYESSKINDHFEEIKKDTEIPLDYRDKIETKIKTIEESLNYLKDYSETVFKSFHSFGDHFNSLVANGIVFHKKLKKLNIISDPKETSSKVKDLIGILKTLKELNLKLNKFFNKHKVDSFDKSKIVLLNSLKDDFWNIYLEEMREYWIWKISEELKKGVSGVLEMKKGNKSEPENIGLFAKWEKRHVLYKKISELKSATIDDKITSPEKEFDVPGRGKINIVKNVQSFPFEDGLKNNYVKKVEMNGVLSNVNKVLNLDVRENPIKTMKDINNSPEFWKNLWEKMLKNPYITQISIEDLKGNNCEFSNGEKAFISLMSCLRKKTDYYLLDEPDVYLGAGMITNHLLNKIAELKQAGKYIVIATHSSSVGINTIPSNFIYRKTKDGEYDLYETYHGNIWQGTFVNLSNKDKIEFEKTIVDNFEGGLEHFNFRKEIYHGKSSEN